MPNIMNEVLCVQCQKPISSDRLEALITLETKPHQFTCLNCAPNFYIKGLFAGESGSSPLILANSIGNFGVIKEKAETVFDL